jgi:hypothetical protein
MMFTEIIVRSRLRAIGYGTFFLPTDSQMCTDDLYVISVEYPWNLW